MILKSSPPGQITITKLKLLLAVLTVATLCVFQSKAQESTPVPSPSPTSATGCSSEANKNLMRNLVGYLDKPTTGVALPLAKDFCKVFSETASESCNLSLNDEIISKFEGAGQASSDVVPLVKCLASAADVSSAEDMNELQARLLDKYKSDFFKKWDLVKASRAQKPEDFVWSVPEVSPDYKKRNQVYETRLALITEAPAKVRDSFKNASSLLKEAVSKNKNLLEQGSLSKSDDGEVTFKTSHFRELLNKKLNGSFDGASATARANEIILDEGLNFRAHPRTESRSWKVCSASTSAAQEGACHTVTVGFDKVSDNCGTDALLGLVFQSGDTWVLMAGSSSYRVDIGEILKPKTITLTKEHETYHSWNFPESFTPEFISSDLHSIYAKTKIYSEEGKRLGSLHLVLRDNGRFQFVQTPNEASGFIRITGKDGQKIKSLDGSSAEIHIPHLMCL